ncbi:MAG: YggS family pyridoxal phosphate-dependent enzyme [Candidatus Aminicenantia bacterium]
MSADIKENLVRIREKIEISCKKVGRNPDKVKLVAATKTVPVEKIREAIAAGVSIIGENRVQEAEKKISELKDKNVEWHMIGYLQKNKVNKALNLFKMIQSVSSLALAEKINKSCQRINQKIPCLLEINIGRESTKSGFLEEELWEKLENLANLPYLETKGLMVIPPFLEPEEVRPYFIRLREIKEKINQMKIPGLNPTELSMGMSQDFVVAIEEGATMVRLGTAIFGPRA